MEDPNSQCVSYPQITLDVKEAVLPAVIADETLWFTQKTIAYLLSITKQAVSCHLRELDYNNLASNTKNFSVTQREGARVVQRTTKHYPFLTAYSIAVAARRTDCMAPVMRIAEQYGITVNEAFIAVRKEHQLQDLLAGILSGIVSVKPQYRLQGFILDFYIPELNLGIEYDEYPHQSPKRKVSDILRQNQLQHSTGIRFIRIQPGTELQGINAILKLLIS